MTDFGSQRSSNFREMAGHIYTIMTAPGLWIQLSSKERKLSQVLCPVPGFRFRRFGLKIRPRIVRELKTFGLNFWGHGSGGQFLRGFQAGDGAVFAQGHHDREQAGRDSLSGQDDAGAVDQCAGFHLFFRGEVAQQSFGSGFGESFIRRRVAFAQFHQQPADSFIRQKFFYRGGIGLKRVGEVRAERCGKILQAAGARLEQVDGRKQPVAVGVLGLEAGFVPLFLNQRE